MSITSGSLPNANDVRNIWNTTGNVLIGKTGTIYVPVYIDNVSGVANVYLYLWGKAAGSSTTAFNHGMLIDHHHSIYASEGTSVGNTSSNENGQVKVFNIGDSNQVGEVSVGNIVRSTDSFSAPLEQDPIEYTNVPQAVEIWIDGTQYTATIGDPNTKGATMYDSGNDDWGVDGTTEWDTGELDLTSLITWTAGMHYIEFKETGGTGGTLVYSVHVRPW